MSDRAAPQIPYRKRYVPVKLLGIIEVYYILFAVYIICYAVLQHTVVSSCRCRDTYNVNYEALVYLFSYSAFTFTLVLKAAVTYSVYEYYVALFILFQKLIVITAIAFRNPILGYKMPQFEVIIILCVLNYVEFAYLVANLFTRRREINLYLFKLTGVDPSVNSK